MTETWEDIGGAPQIDHKVHVYFTVRAALTVPASNHESAMRSACEDFYPADYLRNGAEDAEEITGFLVDEAGDVDFERSRTYDHEMQPSDFPSPMELARHAAAVRQAAQTLLDAYYRGGVDMSAEADALQAALTEAEGICGALPARPVVSTTTAEGDESDDICRTCGAQYDDGGDGFDGECPSCADRSGEREELETAGYRVEKGPAGWNSYSPDGLIMELSRSTISTEQGAWDLCASHHRDDECTCDARSWHGDEHDSQCPLAGLPRVQF